MGFRSGFEKTAGSLALSPATKKKLYKGLEYGGLGTLAAIDAHSAHEAQKRGDRKERNKALLGTGALVGLMGATHLAGH